MKKVLFMIVAAAAFTFASCSSDECCDCSGPADDPNVGWEGGPTEVCEDDIENTGESWGDAKAGFNMIGCDCD